MAPAACESLFDACSSPSAMMMRERRSRSASAWRDIERFIASGRFMKLIEIADVLRARLPAEHTKKVPKRVMPNWMVKAIALVNPGLRSIMNELGKTRDLDTSHARDELGWETRAVEETIVDCAQSLIAHGVVKV